MDRQWDSGLAWVDHQVDLADPGDPMDPDLVVPAVLLGEVPGGLQVDPMDLVDPGCDRLCRWEDEKN